MPYVPLRPNYSESRKKVIVNMTFVGGQWITETLSSTVSRTFEFASVSRTLGGKKVALVSGGYWSPVRPYRRRATLASISGGPVLWGNSPIKANCTRFTQELTLPSNDPNTPYTLCSLSSANTNGLLDGSGPVLSDNTKNRLITECKIKIGDRQVNYGESLGEARQTVSQIARSSISLLKAYRALRRGNFSQMAKILGVSKKEILNGKTLSDKWLSAQYGWLPLMSDIYDSAKLYQEGLRTRSQILSRTRQLADGADYNFSSAYADMKGSVSVSHRCKLWYRLDSSTLSTLHSLGLINPLEVAWAVQPYSFVIDWFLPIGALLEASSATMGLTFVDGVITSIAEVTAKGDHKAGPGSAPYKLEGNHVWNFSHYAMSRSKVIDFALPYFKSPFSSTHVTSALALLRQLQR